ncbi:MAG TPA: hypothetical protein VMG10_12235 [Gemmataceae bacterium]|nr:hypothetical protein [Gemmataceae bacterium]
MSDPKRLHQVYQHIARIKCSDYPAIVGNTADGGSGYRIEERPFQHLAEPAKLAILQEAVDWSGITNRDQATILLSEIDPGRITASQRTRLIAAAAGEPHDRRDTLRDELFREARPQPQPEHTHERQRKR